MSIKHKLQVLRAHVVTLGTELSVELKNDILQPYNKQHRHDTLGDSQLMDC